MGNEQAGIGLLPVTDHRPYSGRLNLAADRSGSATSVNWHSLSLFLITSGLLAYGGYLASENWHRLLRLMAAPTSPDSAIVATAIQIVAALLPGLSYAMICFSWRRDASWLFRSAGLRLIGLVAAAIELFTHFIG